MKSLSEQQALQQIPGRLAALLGLKAGDVCALAEARVAAKPPRADLALAAGVYQFVVEYKSRANAADVLAAIRRVREQAAALGRKAIPLVGAPYMGEVGRQLCAEAGVNWLDLSGNAHLEAPGLHVHVEGKPNQFTRPGRPSTVFAPKSARITRWLLIHPEERFSQQQLADATGLDKGLTSRVVRALEAQRLVARNEDGAVKVADFDALLEAWREAYDFSKHHIVRGHIAARSGDDVLRQLSGALRQSKAEYAATGLAAAWLMNPFAGFRLVVFYVAELPSEDKRRAIGFHPESRAENVWLVVPNDEAVFHGAADREGVRCVHPVQAYLDLKNHPERSAEAAEKLRRKFWSKESHA
ncbi:MAG: MarR family transcriptional regulator [Verrucomicrobia bacterium]|nr:MarR family transcriptional regulator [Verrucomicrobiota bacterium]